MGNRSRYVATAAVTPAAVMAARRRARLRRAADAVRETILPTHVADLPTGLTSGVDEAHAPGHQHLPRPEDREPNDTRVFRRARGRYAHGMRQRLSDR